MMEKRVILAIALSALVFLLFSYYQQKYIGGQRPLQPVTQEPVGNEAEQTQKNSSIKAEAPAPPAPILPEADDTKASAQTIEVSGSLYRAIIDNRGGVLKSWKLNDYLASKKIKTDKEEIFEMIAGSRGDNQSSYPASMIFPDKTITALANNEYYQVSIEDGSGSSFYAPPVTVVLKLQRGDLKIEKRFRFKKDNYIVELSMICEKGGKPLEGRFLLGEDLGPPREHFINPKELKAVYYSEGKARRESPPKDEKEIQKIYGDVRWVGLDMQYFTILAIPDKPLPYFDIQRHLIEAVGLDNNEVKRILIKTTTPVDGSLHYQLYLGPKNQSDLKAITSVDVTGVSDLGWFSFLAKPLLASLKWINQYVHNYGYAIIILTFLISLLLFPLRLKQMLSMKKMQVVQPKMKAIQEKYRRYNKTDPKRAEMNREVMALYKEHGVNPLGGCLPMLPQMPLLWAFYSLLSSSIELRQAPFFGWIQDLSIKDPYYVLPIVMGITMFISQKMTPMAPGADPKQAKMMLIMPVVLTFMFKELSSGLNLYFLCSNIFGIAFQKIFENWIGRSPQHAKAKR
jgi:YidC/Oxa1 family membrane protein insertase